MRTARLGLGIGLALGLALATGCNNFDRPQGGGIGAAGINHPQPAPERLVAYLNGEAEKISGLQSTNVTLITDEGTLHSAKLFCRGPRDFRLVGNLLSNPAVDLGSNNREFWWWVSGALVKDGPPYVYHCDYEALDSGRARVRLPFHPDMLMSGLGLAKLDPNGKYEVKTVGKTFELIESTTSPQGDPVQRVVVLNRNLAKGKGQPQVLAHILRDKDGKEVSKADILKVQDITLPGGAVVKVPREIRMTLNQPQQAKPIEMRIKVTNWSMKSFSPDLAGKLFSREALSAFQGYDLATGRVTRPGAGRIERVEGVEDRSGTSLMPGQ